MGRVRWKNIRVAILWSALLPCAQAWGSCSGETVVTQVTLPATLAIPRNNGWSPGNVLWASGWMGSGTVDVRGCDPASDRQIWSYAQARAATAGSAYATNVPGIGVQVAWLPSLQSPNFGALPSRLVTWPATVRNLDSPGVDFSLPSRFQIRLVKTGNISAGVLHLSAPLAFIAFGSARVAELHVSGSTQISISSCVTPDVIVDLGTWEASRLQEPGSTTPAVPFQVAIRACPPGLNGISYRFLSNEAQPEAGVIGPKVARSSATGVGIRVSWPDDSPLLLSRLQDVIYVDGGGPVDDPGAGGDYALPLRASLYRLPTGALTPGTVTGELEFTMYYE